MNSRGWSFADNKLEKEFKFTSYFDIVNFANEVMQIAIELDHHPEIYLSLIHI
jgi:pterin-4a-carbinolamine dehydratase